MESTEGEGETFNSNETMSIIVLKIHDGLNQLHFKIAIKVTIKN